MFSICWKYKVQQLTVYVRAKTKPWGRRNCPELRDMIVSRHRSGEGYQYWRSPRTQWPPSFLNGRSLEPPRLFLELAARPNWAIGGEGQCSGVSSTAIGPGISHHIPWCNAEYGFTQNNHQTHKITLSTAKHHVSHEEACVCSRHDTLSWTCCFDLRSLSPSPPPLSLPLSLYHTCCLDLWMFGYEKPTDNYSGGADLLHPL